MKLAFALSLLVASTQAFAPAPRHAFVRTSLASTAEETDSVRKSKKEERLKFMKNEQFHRRGFKEVRQGVEDVMGEQFESDLVDELKSSEFVVEKDGVKVHLAKVRMQRRIVCDLCMGESLDTICLQPPVLLGLWLLLGC